MGGFKLVKKEAHMKFYILAIATVGLWIASAGVSQAANIGGNQTTLPDANSSWEEISQAGLLAQFPLIEVGVDPAGFHIFTPVSNLCHTEGELFTVEPLRVCEKKVKRKCVQYKSEPQTFFTSIVYTVKKCLDRMGAHGRCLREEDIMKSHPLSYDIKVKRKSKLPRRTLFTKQFDIPSCLL